MKCASSSNYRGRLFLPQLGHDQYMKLKLSKVNHQTSINNRLSSIVLVLSVFCFPNPVFCLLRAVTGNLRNKKHSTKEFVRNFLQNLQNKPNFPHFSPENRYGFSRRIDMVFPVAEPMGKTRLDWARSLRQVSWNSFGGIFGGGDQCDVANGVMKRRWQPKRPYRYHGLTAMAENAMGWQRG